MMYADQKNIVKPMMITWLTIIAIGLLNLQPARGQEPGSEMFLLARNGFEPVIAPVFFEKVEASASIGTNGDLMLKMQYTQFSLQGTKNGTTKKLFNDNTQVLVKIILSNEEVIYLNPLKPIETFFEAKNVVLPANEQKSAMQGFGMMCSIPSQMPELIKKTPVIEIQIEYTQGPDKTTNTLSIFSDGREIQADKSESKSLAEVYRQGWLNLMDYYVQLHELVRGT